MNDEMRNDATHGATGADASTNQNAYTGGDVKSEGRKLKEEFRVSGEAVLAKVKELVREGNVRRITIKNDDGRTLIEIPLTLGVIGTVLLPVWAAIGAIAALAANLTIAVERVEGPVAAEAASEGAALHPASQTPASPTHGVAPNGGQERNA